MTPQYFSIGEYCSTAYQIRRHTGTQDAFFFDWLVTRGHAFDFFSKPVEKFLLPGRWDLAGEPGNENIRVRDIDSQLLFQHEFPTANGRVDASLVERHLPVARAKFNYLRGKTLTAMRDAGRCVLIRAENALCTPEQALERLAQIQAVFKPVNPGLKVVLASTGFDREFQHPECLLVKLAPCEDWVGDIQSWDRLFNLTEQLLCP